MDWDAVSDADLSRRCRQGDAEAWRHLIRRCAPTAYRVAMQVLREPVEAEDACQEVFMRMHRSFDSFDPTRTLKPWVGKIAYNVAVRRRGGVIQQATRAVSPERLDEGSAAGGDPESELGRKRASEHLARAMETLSPEDRALLTLRYREGLSDSEVAEASEMRVNTVKTRIFRARGKLRESLGRMLRGERP